MAKGARDDCCCGGCAQPPAHDGESIQAGSDIKYNPFQHFCCACIPYGMCVKYSCNGAIEEAAEILRGCRNNGEANYSGQIPVDGVLRDVELRFEVDSENKCYLVLVASYFGADGTAPEDKIEITDTVRETLCPRCEGGGKPPLEFTVTTADCVHTTKLLVQPSKYHSLKKLPLCCDAADPCDDYPEDTRRTLSCGGLCNDCACICWSADIVEIRDGVETTNSANWCNDTLTAGEYTITITRDAETGCCSFSLDIGSNQTLDVLGDVAIGTEANPCPKPEAEWSYTDRYTNEAVSVYFFCHDGCGNESSVTITGCCEDLVPKVLTATIDGGVDCCGSFTVPLIYDATSGEWYGSHPTAMCDHDVEVTLACSGSNWTITLDGSGCTADSQVATGTCDPINLTATLSMGGVGCCDDIDIGPYNVTVTITE